jgi:hypothetical protein
MEKLQMKKTNKYFFIKGIFFLISLIINTPSFSNEMLIGKEKISPGIDIIFEGAVRDDIEPKGFYLNEDESDIHIEALATWSSNGPGGSIEGGFIPYLDIQVEIINQKTKEEGVYELIPHLNMSDNFHYANNLKLPGNKNDTYIVTFIISPPKKGSIGFHFDWRKEVNDNLISKEIFLYKDLNFSKIASQKRR